MIDTNHSPHFQPDFHSVIPGTSVVRTAPVHLVARMSEEQSCSYRPGTRI